MDKKTDFSMIRKPDYLSPSALTIYNKSPEEYFTKYLAIERPPRFPQTKPMSIGSGFDAFIKASLSARYLPEPYDLRTLFNDQVEKHNRDVWDDSSRCFESYKASGAYDSLIRILDSSEDIVFESRITKVIEGVPIMGVPDMMCMHNSPEGSVPIIFDWKVNGFYSKASPKAGYSDLFPDRVHHKDCFLIKHYGINHNAAWFNNLYPDYAAQLAAYSWLCGLPVGNAQFNMIHQLAWGPKGLRVAVLAGICEPDFQIKLVDSYKDLWNRIQTNTVLPADKVEQLNKEASVLYNSDDLFRELVR